jgi:hypothetical protein
MRFREKIVIIFYVKVEIIFIETSAEQFKRVLKQPKYSRFPKVCPVLSTFTEIGEIMYVQLI